MKNYYYKITHKTKDEIIYASCNILIKPDKLADIMGLENYIAEFCTKEEYEQNTK